MSTIPSVLARWDGSGGKTRTRGVRVAEGRGQPEPLETALRDWQGRLAARSRAMLGGAAELEAYLAGGTEPVRPERAMLTRR